jgi:hypothetical protein
LHHLAFVFYFLIKTFQSLLFLVESTRIEFAQVFLGFEEFSHFLKCFCFGQINVSKRASDSRLEGGVNRAKLKFTNINTTTSRG